MNPYKKFKIKFSLDAKKTLDGNIIIFDHGDIDIVIMPEKNKVMAFAKDTPSDIVYGAQDRMFKYLIKRGVVSRDSIRSGNVYGSVEGSIPPTENAIPVKLIMLNLSRWIEKERPYFEHLEDFEEEQAKNMYNPEDEDSTELGEIPHENQQGSMIPGIAAFRGPYWQSYSLEESKNGSKD